MSGGRSWGPGNRRAERKLGKEARRLKREAKRKAKRLSAHEIQILHSGSHAIANREAVAHRSVGGR